MLRTWFSFTAVAARSSALIVCLMGLAACHGNVALGTAPQTKPLDTMTPTEVKAVASDLIDQYAGELCAVAGAAAGAAGQDCATAQQTCETQARATGTVDELATAIAQCSATPADITACLGPMLDAMAGVNCQSGMQSLSASSQSYTKADLCACINVYKKCPGFSGGGANTDAMSSMVAAGQGC